MKRLRRPILWLISLGIMLAPLDAGAGMGVKPVDRPAALTLLQSDAQRIVLELSTPSYTIQPDKTGVVEIQRITMKSEKF